MASLASYCNNNNLKIIMIMIPLRTIIVTTIITATTILTNRRRAWLVESLYRGMQCSSCGLRYPPEQTLQYSHHLDWHFRQNIKQQESTKKANVRKFYFSIEDWLQYEEIEDVEERGE